MSCHSPPFIFPIFRVQAVVRAEPSLAIAPLALIDGAPPIWNVVAVNEVARRAGIEAGMARAAAEQFESVEIRFRSRTREKAAHAALLDIAWSISPRVEDTSPGTVVIDLAGLSSLFGSGENIVHLLTQRIEAFGLIAQIAVSDNIDVAIHAALGLPGITLIAAGEESQRLAPLPIGILGASAETLETLTLWGVRTCEALAALPVLQLSERLGQEGVRLHESARGAGVRALVLAEPATSFEEELELDDSVEELEPLSFLLGRLLDQLCFRLAARSLAPGVVRLRFALDPAGQKDVQIRSQDSRYAKISCIYEKILALPVPIRDSKMLLNLLRLALQNDPPPAPILKISIAAEPSRPCVVQTCLFIPPSPDVMKLELTIARLANLVGEPNVGSPRLVDTHRPDEFCMARFTAPDEQSGQFRHRQNKKPPLTGAPSAPATTCAGFRTFRSPFRARVLLHECRPKAVAFHGARGEVLAASGPWRTSGDWWREDAWYQDEWDLEIRFPVSHAVRQNCEPATQHALYRFYFDSISQSWFVRGVYD